MEALPWVILTLYIVGYFGFTVTITRFLASSLRYGNEDPDVFDKIASTLLGMILAVFWPLVIPGEWFYKRAFGKKHK